MIRIRYIDTAKLIGLALVCFCHIPPIEGDFHIWVYSFHMPLFFILSGMFFSSHKTSVFAAIKQLLVPFFVFNAIAILFNACLSSVFTNSIVFPEINLKEWMVSKYAIGPSWFLLSLFYIRVFCSTLYKYFKILGLTYVSILLLLVLYLTCDYAFWNILSLGSTILGLPFYIFGYIFKDFILRIIDFKGGYVSAFITLPVSLISILNGLVGIHIHSYLCR